MTEKDAKDLDYFISLYKSTNYAKKRELLTTAIFILLGYKRLEGEMIEELIKSLENKKENDNNENI